MRGRAWLLSFCSPGARPFSVMSWDDIRSFVEEARPEVRAGPYCEAEGIALEIHIAGRTRARQHSVPPQQHHESTHEQQSAHHWFGATADQPDSPRRRNRLDVPAIVAPPSLQSMEPQQQCLDVQQQLQFPVVLQQYPEEKSDELLGGAIIAKVEEEDVFDAPPSRSTSGETFAAGK